MVCGLFGAEGVGCVHTPDYDKLKIRLFAYRGKVQEIAVQVFGLSLDEKRPEPPKPLNWNIP